MHCLLQAISIVYSKLSVVQTAKADVLIRPRVGHIGSGDFGKNEAIMEGEKAALAAMPEIRSLLVRLLQEGEKTE
jgi:NTE family protein